MPISQLFVAGAVGASMSILITPVKRTMCFDVMKQGGLETLQICSAIFVMAIGANMLSRFMAFSA
ncbi:hypothetical protein [Roseovarius confluentis]|uniref:hypothetical protein n=1 Tax=Roseovarius confluentis TaxID=1852027 RepID=UPI003C7B741C